MHPKPPIDIDRSFAHHGEKARHREPLRFQYFGEVCHYHCSWNYECCDTCEFRHIEKHLFNLTKNNLFS